MRTLYCIAFLAIFSISLSAQQNANIVFSADKDCEVIIYKPIDGGYQDKIPADRLLLNSKETVSYDWNISPYSFLYCQFPHYQSQCNLLVFPGDSIQVHASEGEITFRGSNHAGLQFYYDNFNKFPYIEKFLKIQNVFKEYINGSRDLHTILPAIDDSLVSQTEQTIYIISYCPWISGFERNIWDSIQTQKGQRTIELHAYTPIDNYFDVMFSKEGPDKLDIYALPNDTVEMEINHTDVSQKTVFKKALKGKIHNEFVNKTKTSRSYWAKKRLLEVENNADSLANLNREIINYYLKKISQAKYSSEASTDITILRTYLAEYISADTIQAIREQFARKFPDSPRAALNYGYNKTQTKHGIEADQRIKEVEIAKANYKRVKQKTKIGNVINLSLYNIDGKKIGISDLTDCQYAYVDIWASWCKPCRKQFPYIKTALNKYSHALKLYAISIDKNHKAWEKAIKNDSLQDFVNVIGTNDNWDLLKEVSDLGVERIPRNFLLDSNHIIIAKDLHDSQLVQALDSLIHQ